MNRRSKMTLKALVFSMGLAAFLLSACGGGTGGSSGSSGGSAVAAAPKVSAGSRGPASIPRGTRAFKTDALVYNGPGTWADEVPALENILSQHGASFKEVNAADLNAMSLDDLDQFGMIVWPGGLGGTQMLSLTSATKLKLRQAVQDRGVSWIGFCAGSFVAVAPTPEPGKDPSYGLSIVNAPELQYYYLENQGTDIAMTKANFADGTSRDLVWYGGPVTPEFDGGVVAKYPNGQAAISETWSGNGFVMLSAVHPAAPQLTRTFFGLNDSDGLDFDIAWKLLEATLKQSEIQAF